MAAGMRATASSMPMMHPDIFTVGLQSCWQPRTESCAASEFLGVRPDLVSSMPDAADHQFHRGNIADAAKYY
jgi:hypothetical protein